MDSKSGKIDMNKEDDSQFLPGAQNRAIRYYFYLNAGLNILNQFRNLFLGIFALYFALKLDHWWILAALFLPSLLVLTIVGYFAVHKVNKVSEWLSIRFSSHYALSQYDLQKENNELLKEILKKL